MMTIIICIFVAFISIFLMAWLNGLTTGIPLFSFNRCEICGKIIFKNGSHEYPCEFSTRADYFHEKCYQEREKKSAIEREKQKVEEIEQKKKEEEAERLIVFINL